MSASRYLGAGIAWVFVAAESSRHRFGADIARAARELVATNLRLLGGARGGPLPWSREASARLRERAAIGAGRVRG